jgi:hypothetical protein
MYSLLEMFGFLDLLHKISLKPLSMFIMFLLYSPTLLPPVSVILALNTFFVKWSSYYSISNTKIRPSLIACSTPTIDELADYLPPYFADYFTTTTSSVDVCLLSQLSA